MSCLSKINRRNNRTGKKSLKVEVGEGVIQLPKLIDFVHVWHLMLQKVAKTRLLSA